MDDDSSELPQTDVEVDATALPPDPTEVISEDGQTTTLILDENEPAKDDDWFGNLAETLDEGVLDSLAEDYLQHIDDDTTAREERDKMQAEGLKKAGLGDPAPGGANFEGASRVTHPVLIESYIDFAATTMKELFPPNGPVRTKIEGQPNKAKLDRATRKAAFMNWQLCTQIKSYRPELEILLSQLPVGGSQYMKIYWDESRKRQNIEFISIDEIVLPYYAHSFATVPRKFHKMTVSDLEYERRIYSGLYRDLSLPSAYQSTLDETDSERQKARIEGKKADYTSETGERIIYEGVIYDIIEGDDKAPESKACPYLITIDEQSRKVLALYRNWDEDSETQEELEYIVDFTFIPFDGVFGLSLLQCLAGMPDALTGALRALLDSGLINTISAGIKLKSPQSGASLSVSPTEIKEVDAMGQDDIRKVYMPMPFNPPSPSLFQLLGFLDAAAKGVVGTAEEKVAEASNQMPVGTALALIEQGAKVFSAIHARLHESQRRVLEILHRLNRDHLPDGKFFFGTDPKDYVTREDFEGSMDVRPVSDPNIFSETQRFAQVQFVLQAVTQVAGVNAAVVQIIDWRKFFAQAFTMAKIVDFEDFLPPSPEAVPLNPADENVNLVMGKPVKAFEGQNHEAHVQVLLDFALNPMFGKSPIIAAQFIPHAMNHLMDHLLTWYGEMMKLDAAAKLGTTPDKMDWDNNPDAAVAMAQSIKTVDAAAQLAFGKIPAVIAQAMQQLQAMMPKPPVDPMVQVEQQKVAGQQQIEQGKLSLAQQKQQADAAEKVQVLQSKLAAAQQDYELAMQQMGVSAQTQVATAQIQAGTAIRTANIQSQTEMAKTVHDNQSAQEIAEMKIASDEKTKLQDGASLSDSKE